MAGDWEFRSETLDIRVLHAELAAQIAAGIATRVSVGKDAATMSVATAGKILELVGLTKNWQDHINQKGS